MRRNIKRENEVINQVVSNFNEKCTINDRAHLIDTITSENYGYIAGMWQTEPFEKYLDEYYTTCYSDSHSKADANKLNNDIKKMKLKLIYTLDNLVD